MRWRATQLQQSSSWTHERQAKSWECLFEELANPEICEERRKPREEVIHPRASEPRMGRWKIRGRLTNPGANLDERPLSCRTQPHDRAFAPPPRGHGPIESGLLCASRAPIVMQI